MRLLNRVTGAVRDAPWIALRTAGGAVYFANLLTGRTRWLPPHRWMEGWISRRVVTGIPVPTDDSAAARAYDDAVGGLPWLECARGRRVDDREPLPPIISRLRVDGGAPYMDETGLPQYTPDAFDWGTFPRVGTYPGLGVQFARDVSGRGWVPC